MTENFVFCILLFVNVSCLQTLLFTYCNFRHATSILKNHASKVIYYQPTYLSLSLSVCLSVCLFSFSSYFSVKLQHPGSYFAHPAETLAPGSSPPQSRTPDRPLLPLHLLDRGTLLKSVLYFQTLP